MREVLTGELLWDVEGDVDDVGAGDAGRNFEGDAGRHGDPEDEVGVAAIPRRLCACARQHGRRHNQHKHQHGRV